MRKKSKIKKEKWGTPKLIICKRSNRPEERVLGACKSDIIAGTTYGYTVCGGLPAHACPLGCDSLASS